MITNIITPIFTRVKKKGMKKGMKQKLLKLKSGADQYPQKSKEPLPLLMYCG